MNKSEEKGELCTYIPDHRFERPPHNNDRPFLHSTSGRFPELFVIVWGNDMTEKSHPRWYVLGRDVPITFIG
jgi:hypothetical protein